MQHPVRMKKGFTLVEVVVASSIAAILGAGLLSMLVWMFQTSKEGRNMAHLQDQGNVILEDYARHVRNSTSMEIADAGKKIRFVLGGVPKDSLIISGNSMYEHGISYKVGGEPVLLVGSKSTFTVDVDSRAARLDIVLSRAAQTFAISSGFFRCRN